MMTIEQKLALLNSLPLEDYDTGSGEIGYVMVLDDDQSRRVLRACGFSEEVIDSYKFSDANGGTTLDIVQLGWDCGATHWSVAHRFTVGKPKQTETCEMCLKDTGSTDVVCDECHVADAYADQDGAEEVA